ncbi:MAG TPA: DUF1361 domain-containing protein [Armatimonadota bacterium]|nr:DUF1361 domain-containing protein [Armatimonadota bacterium]
MLISALYWVAWNTFLALIPVVLGYAIYRLARRSHVRPRILAKAAIAILGIAWLVFLPNTCYLVTEWRHFLDAVGYLDLHKRWQADSGSALALMMYALFYLCFSGTGLITFTLAIRPVASLLRQRGATMWIWGMPFFLLMATGVYLGLILRFNTWDLVGRAGPIWETAAGIAHRPMLASFIVAFAGFLWLAYAAVDIWIDGVIYRWKKADSRL